MIARMHALLREMANNDRAHDPWGACLGALGPICDVLHVEQGRIPADAGYRPAASLRSRADLDVYDDVTGENCETADIYAALDDGTLTIADLEHAARVLHRYADIVCAAGRDY